MKKTTPLVITGFLAITGLTGCAGTAPTNIGVINNQLTLCPSSPNCVSSGAEDEGHAISAISLNGSQEETKTKLLAVLDELGGHIVTNQDEYIRAEFTSTLMRFVDDVEFYIQQDGIQVRSASRIGRSDFNVNRSRIESIREALKAK